MGSDCISSWSLLIFLLHLWAFGSGELLNLKPDIQNIHGLLNAHFFQIYPPVFQLKKGNEPESQKINFCIGNYMYFMVPFWCLVPVMTSITLRKSEHRWLGAKNHCKTCGEVFFSRFCSRFLFLTLWWLKFIRKIYCRFFVLQNKTSKKPCAEHHDLNSSFCCVMKRDFSNVL